MVSDLHDMKERKSCESPQELSNEYDAFTCKKEKKITCKIGVDTAENEPLKVPDYI